MAKKPRVYAFIDSQNLNLGVSNDVANKQGKIIYKGRKLNFHKFRDYLTQRYGVTKAFIFVGLVPSNNKLYTYLQEAGFIIVFKQVTWYIDADGRTVVKGNVDTDITLHACAVEINEYDKAIFVSGDGDYLSTYQFIESLGKLAYIFVPNRYKYSKLLKPYHQQGIIRFVSDIQSIFYNPSKKTRSGVRSESLDLPGRGDSSTVAKNAKIVNDRSEAK